ERFHRAHEREYTFRLEAVVEVVNVHLVAYSLVEKPGLHEEPLGEPDASSACTGMRDVDMDGTRPVPTVIYDRSLLRSGMRAAGPALVEESATVTLVPSGAVLSVDRFGGLHIDFDAGGRS